VDRLVEVEVVVRHASGEAYHAAVVDRKAGFPLPDAGAYPYEGREGGAP
jgi:hypothetical protein